MWCFSHFLFVHGACKLCNVNNVGHLSFAVGVWPMRMLRSRWGSEAIPTVLWLNLTNWGFAKLGWFELIWSYLLNWYDRHLKMIIRAVRASRSFQIKGQRESVPKCAKAPGAHCFFRSDRRVMCKVRARFMKVGCRLRLPIMQWPRPFTVPWH